MKKTLTLAFLLLALCETTLEAQNYPKNPNKTDAKGLKQGMWTAFYNTNWESTTNKDSIMYYSVGELKDSKYNGLWTYYNAQTKAKTTELNFSNGVNNGIAKAYHPNGKLSSQGFWLAGERLGDWTWYHENGNKKIIMMFSKGKAEGLATEYDEAGKIIKQVAFENGVVKKNTQEDWDSLDRQAEEAYKAGDVDKALVYYEKAKTAIAKELGTEHNNYVVALNNLAYLYEKQKKYTQAEPYYVEALALRKKNLGEKHPDYIQNLKSLDNLRKKMGK
jgi:antitoxin component YwqK of YwqJK toxin-antitoxin module